MRKKLDFRVIKDRVITHRMNEFTYDAFKYKSKDMNLDPSKIQLYFIKKFVNGEIIIDSNEVREYLGLKIK